jgi:hypothetical protein
LNNLLVALFFLATVVIVGWPWVRPTLARLGLNFARTKILSWSAPNPKAQGALLTFTGVEIGHRFVGVVTSQQAQVDYPEEFPQIVKPKIEVVAR